MRDTAWTIVLVGIWLFLAFMPMVLNYQYICFSDDGENIVFRYFTAGIVGGKKNSVEINKTSFSGYKTENKVFWPDSEHYSFSEVAAGSCKISSCLYQCTYQRRKGKSN